MQRHEIKALINALTESVIPVTSYMDAENAAGAADRWQREEFGEVLNSRVDDLRYRRDHLRVAMDGLTDALKDLQAEIGYNIQSLPRPTLDEVIEAMRTNAERVLAQLTPAKP